MDLFRARSLPFLCRHSYVVEMQHLILWGFFAGAVEGGVCAVVAAKTFNGSFLLITVITATPMFANLVSLAWGVLCRGRRKLLLLTALAGAGVTIAASIGATPRTPWGGWIFALQIALARTFLSGVATVRTSLWRSNYPQRVRGRITARLQYARASMGVVAIALTGVLFDRNPDAFRWVYPSFAFVGAAAILLITRERVRGERAVLRHHARERAGDGLPADRPLWLAPFDVVAVLSPRHLLRELTRVLTTDRRFARYCGAQMFLGVANQMIQPVIVLLVTDRLGLSYFESNGLIDMLPQLLLLIALPAWAALFDRVGVLRFRVVNTIGWLGSIVIAGLAAMAVHGEALLDSGTYFLALGLLLASRVVHGLSAGGGAIAWNIGHMHFSSDEDAELYMGIHVSLTGLRGLFAPFLGAWLYVHLGWLMFVAATAICLIGMKQFRDLAREEGAAA